MGKNVLLVVDYQKDFVDGVLGFEKAKTLEKGIVSKIEQYLANGDTVIFTLDTHENNYMETEEGKNLPIQHCLRGTDGWQLYGKLKDYADKENVIIIEKSTFGSDKLIVVLQLIEKRLGESIEKIEVCGVVTNMCVISNAVIAKAASPNAHIVINESITSSFDEEMHNSAIAVMRSMQMEII